MNREQLLGVMAAWLEHVANGTMSREEYDAKVRALAARKDEKR